MILLSDASDRNRRKRERGRRGVAESGHLPRGNALISNSAA